jgi:hypothetical protein
MTTEILNFLLGLSGTIILLLFGVLGYFLKIVHTDAKKAVEEMGKNKGRIELVEQQLNSDVKRIEQTTQLELRNLAATVGKLSNSVELLVKVHLESNHKTS